MTRHCLFGLLLCAAPLAAQDFADVPLPEYGLKIQAFRKLTRLPLPPGKEGVSHVKAHFGPKDQGDYIKAARGDFEWALDILEFPKAKAKVKEGASPQEQERAAEAAKHRASSFKEFVTTDKDRAAKERKFIVQDKEIAAKAPKLPYRYWEYTDVHAMTKGPEAWNQTWCTFAATYDTPDAEIALVVSVPAQKGDKANDKHIGWCTTMVKSGVAMSEKELTAAKGTKPADAKGDAKKDGKPESGAKAASLEAAKKNLTGLKGWDLFTTDNLLVLFSWDPEKPEKRAGMEAFAKDVAGKLEKLRLLFLESFPVHDNMQKAYSVVRICFDERIFAQYSSERSKRDGAFQTGTRELVLYKGETSSPDSVIQHEGFLLFADSYFRAPRPKNAPVDPAAPDRPPVDLSIWYAEGLGEYASAHSYAGGKWTYQGAKNAKQLLKAALNDNRLVALREFVTWTRDRFTGTGVPAYLAQGYALVDLLRRGKKELGASWDPAWDKILDTYRDKMLEIGESKKAVADAFAGVDWDKLEAAFGRWIKEFLK